MEIKEAIEVLRLKMHKQLSKKENEALELAIVACEEMENQQEKECGYWHITLVEPCSDFVNEIEIECSSCKRVTSRYSTEPRYDYCPGCGNYMYGDGLSEV